MPQPHTALRSLIRRLVQESSAAPADAPLGAVAFASNREGTAAEPDTELEARLYKAIRAHFAGLKNLDKESAAQVESILEKGLYPDIFMPPPQPELMRGMLVSEEWLEGVVGRNARDLWASQNVDFIFKPHGGATSWTVDRKTAQEFAGFVGSPDAKETARKKGKRAIIMHARAADNPNKFVMGPGGLYSVKGFDQFSYEKEVVGLGDIYVHLIEWGY